MCVRAKLVIDSTREPINFIWFFIIVASCATHPTLLKPEKLWWFSYIYIDGSQFAITRPSREKSKAKRTCVWVSASKSNEIVYAFIISLFLVILFAIFPRSLEKRQKKSTRRTMEKKSHKNTINGNLTTTYEFYGREYVFLLSLAIIRQRRKHKEEEKTESFDVIDITKHLNIQFLLL